MSSTLDEALVVRLASLANLELSAEETATFARDLSKIVDYVKILEQATAETDAAPLTSVRDQEHRRADEPRPSLDRDAALAQAPRASEDGFIVPAFVDEG